MRIREDELRASGHSYIAGMDEVGRGPLAGPVYAACVILPEDFEELGINDSKKLSAKRREELDAIIRERAIAYGIGIADNNEIDEMNILEATKTAMKRALLECSHMLEDREGALRPDMLLVDAVKLDVGIPTESIIKGDEKCLCIAAASIVGKVARDSYMIEMDSVYPGYDFAGNKGYGTAAHYEGLRSKGITDIHRKTFLKKFEENPNTKHRDSSKKESELGKKVYAVRKGKTTGLFMSWEDCKAQVDGFPGAEYKSFADPSDAMEYLGLTDATQTAQNMPEGVRAYVDGSFDEASGRYSCGVVIVETDAGGNSEVKEMNSAFSDEDAASQRNIAGEIMGARTAIEYCLENGIGEIDIYHDYEGIGKWADGLWKANNPLTQGYRDYVAEARKSIQIKFVKVKAHAGNKYNERADKLAKEALGI